MCVGSSSLTFLLRYVFVSGQSSILLSLKISHLDKTSSTYTPPNSMFGRQKALSKKGRLKDRLRRWKWHPSGFSSLGTIGAAGGIGG